MRELLVLFFVINALFWGLMPHSIHCQFVSKFTNSKCPPHFVHLLIGLLSFIIAILLAQEQWTSELWSKTKSFYSNTVKVIQSGGKLANMAYNAAKNNFDSVEHFTETIDNLSKGKTVQLKLL
jgi:hypothetical protein